MAYNNDPISWGLQNLAGGLQSGLNNKFDFQQKLLEKNKDKEVRQQLARLYEEQGINPMWANQPFEVQKPVLQNAFRHKGISERIFDRLLGDNKKKYSSSQQQVPSLIKDNSGKTVGVQVEGNVIPVSEIPPETLQRLEMADSEMNQGGQEETWAQRLGQFGTGAGVGALQKLAGFTPDISSLPFAAQKLVNPTDVKSWEYEMMERDPNYQSLNVNPEDVIKHVQTNESPLKPLEDIWPTTSNVLNKFIPALTKGTALEPYTTAKSEGGKTAQELGNVTSIFANPTGTIGQKAANILKSAGIALGGQAAKILGEAVTGSEKVGEGLKLGTYIAASLFPGSTGKLAEKGYENFEKNIIDKAAKEGKAIPASSFKKKLEEFSQKVNNDFPHTTEDAKLLKNEIARVKNIANIKTTLDSDKKSIINGINDITKNISTGSNSDLKYVVQRIKNDSKVLQDELNKRNISPNIKSLSKDTINPTRMWNRIKDLNKKIRDHKYNDIAPYLEELNAIQKETLGSFADKISPNGGQILKDANQLYRTSKQIAQDTQKLKSTGNVRFGPGTLLWLTSGGYKAVASYAGLKAAKQYAQRMLNDPVVLKLTKELAGATTAQNIALAKQASDKLNERGETILSKLSSEDQQKIRDAIKKLSTQ